jgi:hypothetical protein
MNWSSADRQLIISADDSGNFVLFDVGANKTDSVYFSKMRITALACCPHKWQWVGVGDATGLVMILNISGKLPTPLT